MVYNTCIAIHMIQLNVKDFIMKYIGILSVF